MHEINTDGVNKDHVRLLIAGLRSGQYPQGRRKLTEMFGGKVVGHCCMGVGCLVAHENGLPLTTADENGSRRFYAPAGTPDLRQEKGYIVDLGAWQDLVFPVAVMEFYGFSEQDPALLIPGNLAQPIGVAGDDNGMIRVTASAANDEHQLDFGQIADAFERTYVPEDVQP